MQCKYLSLVFLNLRSKLQVLLALLELLEGAVTELGAAGGEAAAGISLLNPVVLGVTATVVAGAAVWEIWGKKAYESQQRTNKWGSDVGQQADSALTKFQGFSSKAGSSLTDFEKG
ncbi:MAG: hypothetical protein LKI22_00110 [Liquorilactobacillus nagelii]|jgi:hypothetical protein|uniref:hypothetical protein n=1 Tax=Liquorilactobacillus nagelii TaxID=82688 RepID=UPI00242A654E|nr:hypothetical protein [Liquorilactobacillus nagelii]MCI1632367.1 hypothetical protein [Liquorilactobacillus nagelii]